MKALKERILRDGKCFEGGILKVDNFINHQMDPILMKSIAVEFVRRFASTNINKVITPPQVAVMLAVPRPTACATPSLSTETTLGLSET